MTKNNSVTNSEVITHIGTPTWGEDENSVFIGYERGCFRGIPCYYPIVVSYEEHGG